MTAMPELLPCPFCESVAEYIRHLQAEKAEWSEHHVRAYDDGFAAGQEAMRTDLGLVLASLRWLEECTGETLEGDDAALIQQIQADLEAPHPRPAPR